MSIQELVDNFLIELLGNNFRSFAFPPIGFVAAVMKPDATELARIGEDQCAFTLEENQMIVLRWSVAGVLHANFAGHAEMNAKPVIIRKLEEHSFSARLRANKFRAHQSSLKLINVLATEDPVPRVQAKIDNLRADPGVPLFTKPFDLGELRHRARYRFPKAHQSGYVRGQRASHLLRAMLD